MKIAIVLGTRPEILKNYSIVKALRDAGVPYEVFWTGQHTDPRMHAAFFDQLGYHPDCALDDYAFGRAVDWVAGLLVERRIDHVLVNGDTASSLVGALAAMYTDRRLSHVEAGLRSYDLYMYEERNRIMVDAVAHYLFTYTQREADFLKTRNEYRGAIHNAGNTTVDLVTDFGHLLVSPQADGPFAFVTLHRKELTDRPDRMRSVFDALQEIGERMDVRFPVHPRTVDAMRSAGLEPSQWPAVQWVDPMGPFDALGHVKNAAVVITDSGCVQEEAAIFKVPCVTVRENTERQATVEAGINVVTGFQTDAVCAGALSQLEGNATFPDIYGSPGAGQRIVDVITTAGG